MTLEHASYQRPSTKRKFSFSRQYKRQVSLGIKEDSPYAPVVASLGELLHRLETEVDAPPCWVGSSHFTLIFSRPAGDFLFDVCYGCAVPDGSCWNIPAFVINDFNRTRHQLATVDEAVQTIAMILRHAEFFTPNEEGDNSPAKLKL